MRTRWPILAIAMTILCSHTARADQCGLDVCPVGYTNMYCRKFDRFDLQVTGESVTGIKYQKSMCVVNTGGTVFVAGDLRLFLRVSDVPESMAVEINVKDCSVEFKPLVGGGTPCTFKTGATHFGPFHGGQTSTESYIVEPQIEQRLREVFRSTFASAVRIECSAVFRVSKRRTDNMLPGASNLYKELQKMRERGEIR